MFADMDANLSALAGSPARVSAALDTADALVEALAADPMAVPVDLIISTTIRGLNAVGKVFFRIVSRFGAGADTDVASGAGLDSTRSVSLSGWDPGLTIEVLVTLVASLVSTAIPALFVHCTGPNKKSKKGKSARRSRSVAEAGVDDILGNLYELVLTPSVRSLSVLSRGYLDACLSGSSASTLGKAMHDAQTSAASPDIRADVFAMLDSVLTVLEDTFSNSGDKHTLSSGPMSSSAGAALPSAITGPASVTTLLALECIRELEKLYLPPGANTTISTSASPTPTYTPTDEPARPRPGVCPQSPFEPSHSPQQGYPLTAAAAAHAPDSAPASASNAACSSASQRARPGTARAHHPPLGCGPPRAARNLGEISSVPPHGAGPEPGERARDSVRAAAALPAGGKAKAKSSRTGRPSARSARIAKLARKDAVWWLCAALDRLLPTLPPPSPSSTPQGAVVVESQDVSAGDPATIGTRADAAHVAPDIAHEAVYAALADLLRRTRPRGLSLSLASRASNHAPGAPNPPETCAARDAEADVLVPMRAEVPLGEDMGGKPNPGGQTKTQTESEREGKGKARPRGEAPCHPNSGSGSSDTVDGRAREGDRRAGCAGADAAAMSEVERGMLFAVLERAWLGI
ncbi:hypothetical protein C8Q78DRAFT_1097710 [Trametes maxima]|nr:hypothetical protein C8Q78DRAFT_1097710 [Trametes maxima]